MAILIIIFSLVYIFNNKDDKSEGFFTSWEFEDCVREQLGIYEKDEITIDDLEGIYDLECTLNYDKETGKFDLNGIEYLKNLEVLYISTSVLVLDLEPLKDLTNLRELTVYVDKSNIIGMEYIPENNLELLNIVVASNDDLEIISKLNKIGNLMLEFRETDEVYDMEILKYIDELDRLV